MGIRETIKQLPPLYQLLCARYKRKFLSGKSGTYWGVFYSAVDALAAVPLDRRSDYTNPDIVPINFEQFSEVQLFDWPVICCIVALLARRKVTSLIDFGGHVGVKFLAFRPFLDLPPEFLWNVVELPPMVEEGKRRNAGKHRALAFHHSIAECDNAEIMLLSGVLQYFEQPLDALFAECREKPRYVLVSRLPLCDREGFYTLENFGRVKMAHRVYGREENEATRERLGYDLEVRWRIPYRDFAIPYVRPQTKVQMVGELWRAKTEEPVFGSRG